MSESENPNLAGTYAPTVYFIDDSATMREVIKIAFRRENFHVVTCHDATSALAQFEENPPDVVISDVIMPGKDGYEVCQFIKEHSEFGATPVILMSGVVNRTVAEKAMAVKADDLIRKPFQPLELVTRVRNLLNLDPVAASPAPALASVANPLQDVFANLTPPGFPPPSAELAEPRADVRGDVRADVRGEARAEVRDEARAEVRDNARAEAPAAVPAETWNTARATAVAPSPRPAAAQRSTASPSAVTRSDAPTSPDTQKLRNEITRLDLLVKKLQAELLAERQYCVALEAHIKTLQESD
jgi:CheY-like chemotaxis protein